MAERQWCYIVMAHIDFDGALRTVRRIRTLSPGAKVVLRYEDSAALSPERVREAGAVPLVSAVAAKWGAWSLVEAMLEAFAVAVEHEGADHVVLVSGQDYPIRDLSRYEREIEDRGVDALLEPKYANPDDYRYTWHIATPPFPRHPKVYRAIRHIGWRVGTMTPPVLQMCPNMREGDYRWWFGIPRRDVSLPDGMTYDKSSQWMTLSAAAVRYVLEASRSRPELRDHFAHVRIPDECFVQTLLRNSDLRVEDGVTAGALFVLDTDASPAWLSIDVLDRLARTSAAPFARKMPVGASDELVAHADALTHSDTAS